MTLSPLPPDAHWPLAALWLAFAACVGSFLSMLVHRLPLILDAQAEGREPPLSLSRPASHCPVCGHRLGLLENIPLLGWVLAGGRCRHCKTAIPVRYLALEAVSLGWAAGCLVAFGASAPLAVIGWSVFGWFLLAAAVMDARSMWLPDVLTLGLLWAGLLFSLHPQAGVTPREAIVAAAAGWLALAALGGLWKLLRGVDALGGGDAKLLAAFGAWMGIEPLPWIVMGAFGLFVLGAMVRSTKGPAPLGPMLCVVAVPCAMHVARVF